MNDKLTSILVIILVLVLVYLFLVLNDRKSTTESFINSINRQQKYNLSINPPWILNPEVSPLIYNVTRSVLNAINQKLQTKYQMGQFENVTDDMDLEGNKRFIIDFFVYQFNHQHVNDLNRRIIIDVTLLKNSNNLLINTVNFSNAIKNTDPAIINEDPENTLIIKPSLTGKDNQITNVFRTTLENNKFNNPNGVDLTDINRRPWILPLEIQDKSTIRAFPCQDYGDWWDENAIPLTYEEEKGLPKKKQPGWCFGSYNSATQPQYIVGQRFPQHKKQPSDRHIYDWMFDRRIGISGFPHGSSKGGV
jgi:hypothetical protein